MICRTPIGRQRSTKPGYRLQYYATQFSATDLNGVFYRTPTVEAVRGWRENTPDDLVFSGSASPASRPIGSPCWNHG
jgi:Protein of unknown function DUF72